MISLLATGARMLASQAMKKKVIGAVKKKAVGSAKNFVKGKGGKKKRGSTNVESKGGSLVHSPGKGLTKSASVGSSFIPKGGSIVKSSGGSVAASGDNSFESIRNRFDNIVNLTSQIEAAVETQFNTKKDNQKQIHLEKSKEKKKDREEKLEFKNNFGGGLIKGIGGAAKGLGIGNFLKNILIGGLALLLLNNVDNIKKGFDSLSKGLTSGWDLLRITIISLSTVYRKPIRWIIGTGWKVLKNGAKLFKRAFTKLSKVFRFKKLIKAIASFGLRILNRMTPMGALKNLATRSTSALKRVFNKPTKPANNIRPGPKNLSNAKPKATPKPKGLRLAARARSVFGKQGLKRLSRLGNLFKRIPLIGALLGIGIDLALGEKLDNAIFGALGASLGSAIGAGVGSLILPFAGTFAGGIVGGFVGDWLGKQLYKSMKGAVSGLFGFKDGKNTSDNKDNNKPNNPDTSTHQSSSSATAGGKWGPILDLIGSVEGTYESVYPGGKIPGLTEMTIQEAYNASENWRAKHGGTGAFGSYQLVSDPIGRAKAAGLDPEKDLFSPENQDKIAITIITKYRGIDLDMLKNDPAKAQLLLAQEWAGLPVGRAMQGHNRYVTAEQSYYAGDKKNASGTSTARVRAAFNKVLGGGSSDPIRELGNSEPDSKSQPAKVQPTSSSPAGQSASAVSSHASYESGGGQGNVVVALPGGGQVQGQVVGGGGSSPTLIVDTKSILNRYYKAQLLGFLYKQG